MKIDANWKPHNTRDLINILCDLVKLQMLDLRRSLYGLGNFRLAGPFRRFSIREDIYRARSDSDKEKYFVRFLKFSCGLPKTITSSDGKTQVPGKNQRYCDQTRSKEKAKKCEDQIEVLKFK